MFYILSSHLPIIIPRGIGIFVYNHISRFILHNMSLQDKKMTKKIAIKDRRIEAGRAICGRLDPFRIM